LAACGKMDATYKDFIKDGEIRYSQKPDTLGIRPGKYRVEAWIVAKRSNVSRFKVLWNNRADSVVVPVAGTTGDDTLRVIIDGLQEDTYTFEFFTYDREGNTSIVVDTVGEVFGDKYQSLVTNRLVNLAKIEDTDLVITWFPEFNDEVFRTEVKYTNEDGEERIVYVARDDNETVINEIPVRGSLSYRTSFLPHPHAIDTFYTEYTAIDPVHIYGGFPETFEDTQYAKSNANNSEDVTIGSGLWRFDRFLIGNAAGDRKNGARAIRSHANQTSIFEMLYDVQEGVSKISFYHGICSADGTSKFKVQASEDGGASWQDISEVYTNNAVLEYKEIELDYEGPVRFRFYKLSAAENPDNNGRMNIDDIIIYR
ncbi:MAG TPA: DUF4998 domain-containing protein, partial [Sphingobacterium sp.]|nr:DUF4998 domain-containing protein [Sphingobacterium sp.]